jgi:hypothetical protein
MSKNLKKNCGFMQPSPIKMFLNIAISSLAILNGNSKSVGTPPFVVNICAVVFNIPPIEMRFALRNRGTNLAFIS